jgi:hypothetical protein
MTSNLPYTAVQICPGGVPRCELVHGDPCGTVPGARGPVALFSPGAVVAYAVHAGRPTRLYLFRTLSASAPTARTTVPGVYPHVLLLLALESMRVLRRCRRFFALLRRRGTAASRLPDAFYLRLDRALRARAPLGRLAAALLDAGDAEWSAPATCVLPWSAPRAPAR